MPTSPKVTDVVFWTPSERTFTVEVLPVVVIAALGNWSTSLAVCTITATSAVIPSFTSDGVFFRATVTGYSTTLLTTVDVGETAVTTPVTSVSGRAARVTVAG